MADYVHGYSDQEAMRLKDQADTLARLLYGDVTYPAGALVLEAGCGAGCQTVHLAAGNPDAHFVSVDISPSSLSLAQAALDARGLTNVELRQGDLLRLPDADQRYDHVFVCFVLEHLPDPASALRCLLRVLKPGGTITVIEGDHGSFYCHPETPRARQTVDCLVQLQALAGGDALIGRRLFPLLREAGFAQAHIEPRVVALHGADARQHRARPLAPDVAVSARSLAGDPLAHAVVERGAAVERDRRLHAQPRPAALHAREEADIDLARLVGEQADLNGDARRTQARNALACNQRVRVGHRDHDARDAGLDQRVAAGRRAAVVRAGFQAHAGRCAPHRLAVRSGVAQGHDFRVRSAGLLGVAAADHAAIGAGDDAADAWVGVRQPDRLLRQRQRVAHQ